MASFFMLVNHFPSTTVRDALPSWGFISFCLAFGVGLVCQATCSWTDEHILTMQDLESYLISAYFRARVGAY